MQEKQSTYYNKKEIQYQADDQVYVLKNNQWIKGVIVRQSDNPRSYFIKKQDGKVIRWNTRHTKHNCNFGNKFIGRNIKRKSVGEKHISRTRRGRVIKTHKKFL